MADPTGRLLDLARGVAGRAARDEAVEVHVSRSRETDVVAFDGAVESLSVAATEGIGIRVLLGDGRQGIAWATSLDADIAVAALAEARDNAHFAAPDEHTVMAGPDDVRDHEPPALDLWHESLTTAPTDAKVEIALEAERATRAADARVRGVEAAGYGDALVEHALASSLGVEAESCRTICSVHAVALAGDGADTRTGYGFAAGRDLAALDVASVGADAADRATRLLGARPVPGRRLPVVLDPLVTRAFLGLLASSLSGEAVLKGRSLFADRVGEQVAAPVLTLVDDPTDGRALGATPHDGEGVPTRRNDLVVEGELRGFLHNVSTARRAGTRTTGSATRSLAGAPGVGVRALRAEPGEATPAELLQRAGEGLFVQSVSGLHSGTNPVSGAFSVGVEGLLVRDGELAEPVREVTIASTIPRMLHDVVAVGADLTFLPGATAGLTLLVGEMTMSGS